MKNIFMETTKLPREQLKVDYVAPLWINDIATSNMHEEEWLDDLKRNNNQLSAINGSFSLPPRSEPNHPKQRLQDVRHSQRNFCSLSPLTLNWETPSMNSGRQEKHQFRPGLSPGTAGGEQHAHL